MIGPLSMSFGSVYKVAKLLPSEEEKKKWDLSIKKVIKRKKIHSVETTERNFVQIY